MAVNQTGKIKAGFWYHLWYSIPRKTKRGVAVAAVCLLLAAGLLWGATSLLLGWLGQTDFFQVTSLKIVGCKHVSKETVLRLSGLGIHSNLLDLNIREVKARIESEAWVDTVKLERQWPNQLRLIVRERQPIALLNTAQGFYFVDRHGEPFTALTIDADLDYPVITGLENFFDGQAGLEENKKLLLNALRIILHAGNGSSALPEQNISEIHIAKDGRLVLFLADRSFPIYLGQEMGRQEYYRLAKVLYWLYKKKEFQDVDYIQLDYMENKVLVGKK